MQIKKTRHKWATIYKGDYNYCIENEDGTYTEITKPVSTHLGSSYMKCGKPFATKEECLADAKKRRRKFFNDHVEILGDDTDTIKKQLLGTDNE